MVDGVTLSMRADADGGSVAIAGAWNWTMYARSSDGPIAQLGPGDDETLGRVVGTACLSPSGYVYKVFVRPSFRGMGFGRALMDRMLSIARERGHPHVTLRVHLDNAAALALYRKMRFVATGRVGVDAVGQWVELELELYLQEEERS